MSLNVVNAVNVSELKKQYREAVGCKRIKLAYKIKQEKSKRRVKNEFIKCGSNTIFI